MGPVLQIRDQPVPPLRVMLVDSNAVFRGVCRALLLTEGVDVVADLAPDYGAIGLVRRLRPDVVLVEAPDRTHGSEIAALICSLPDAPTVLLISTDNRSQLAATIPGIADISTGTGIAILAGYITALMARRYRCDSDCRTRGWCRRAWSVVLPDDVVRHRPVRATYTPLNIIIRATSVR